MSDDRMRRREFIGSLIGTAFGWTLAARVQQTDKSAGDGRPFALRDAFVEALRELGWIEGKKVVFEYRYAENRLDRLPELAAELVRLKVDVIVTGGTLAPLAAFSCGDSLECRQSVPCQRLQGDRGCGSDDGD
jgi:putative ABC transport system substrate-binding protein